MKVIDFYDKETEEGAATVHGRSGLHVSETSVWSLLVRSVVSYYTCTGISRMMFGVVIGCLVYYFLEGIFTFFLM